VGETSANDLSSVLSRVPPSERTPGTSAVRVRPRPKGLRERHERPRARERVGVAVPLEPSEREEGAARVPGSLVLADERPEGGGVPARRRSSLTSPTGLAAWARSSSVPRFFKLFKKTLHGAELILGNGIEDHSSQEVQARRIE
jgi:hypothetical protein